jgi:hypothetical protein
MAMCETVRPVRPSGPPAERASPELVLLASDGERRTQEQRQVADVIEVPVRNNDVVDIARSPIGSCGEGRVCALGLRPR